MNTDTTQHRTRNRNPRLARFSANSERLSTYHASHTLVAASAFTTSSLPFRSERLLHASFPTWKGKGEWQYVKHTDMGNLTVEAAVIKKLRLKVRKASGGWRRSKRSLPSTTKGERKKDIP